MTITLEQFSNNVTTTLNGSINNSTTSVVVLTGAAMPSSGNFRILIDSEIMKVTARSSNTLTVSRAQEGTSAASHADGATVTLVLTKEAFQNGVADYSLYGVYSDRPTAGVRGRYFTPSDWEGVNYYDDGAAWNLVLPNGQILPEFTSDGMSTNVNIAAPATYGTVQGFKRLVESGQSSLRGRYKTITPGTTTTVTMCCRMPPLAPSDKLLWGLLISRASDDHSYTTGFQHDNSYTLGSLYYTSLSTYNNTDTSILIYRQFPEVLWMRGVFIYASNTIQCWLSTDGANWNKVMSTTQSGISSADRFGFAVNRYITTLSVDFNFDIYYLAVTQT